MTVKKNRAVFPSMKVAIHVGIMYNSRTGSIVPVRRAGTSIQELQSHPQEQYGKWKLSYHLLRQALSAHVNVLGMEHPGTNSILGLLMGVNKMEETKTDLDQKQELVEIGHKFVDELVAQQLKDNDMRNAKLVSSDNISGESTYFDFAGHVGHGPRGDSVRYRAEKYFLPSEVYDKAESEEGGDGGGR